MKNNKLLILLSLLTILSCTDELDQEPITEKVSSKFYRTEGEIEQGVNGVYASLQSPGLYELYIVALGEVASDNTWEDSPSSDQGRYGQLDEFTTIPVNGIVTTTWQESYIAIQRANIILNRIDNISFTDDQIKKARIGEMQFIRALLYFNLVRVFGDVPLVIEETTDPFEYFGQGRTATVNIYSQIESDLTQAIGNLPEFPSDPGRVVRTAAQALLGKVYLTQGNYSGASTQLQDVISSNRHALLPNLQDIFSVDNENNQEIIFSVQFASGVDGNNEGSSAQQQFSPSGTLDGAKGHNLPHSNLYELYDPEDLRRDAYIGISSNGLLFSNKMTRSTTVNEDGPSDQVVLRYADVVLMLAESLNEQGYVINGQAFDLLNEIRNRSGLSNMTSSELPDQVSFRNAIELERRLELVGEGHRWFDLKRTGKAIQTMNTWFSNQGILITIDEHDLLLPIPLTQITTDSSLKQNPGY